MSCQRMGFGNRCYCPRQPFNSDQFFSPTSRSNGSALPLATSAPNRNNAATYVKIILICVAILVCRSFLYVTWARSAPRSASLRCSPRQVISLNESFSHSELVSTFWVLDTIPRQAPSVKMTGIQHGFLVSSVKK
jgi:hypothetical protein